MPPSDDERTPPRGGATHSIIDIAELTKRTADRELENRHDIDDIKPVVMAIDARTARLETKIDLALRPIELPLYIRAAAVVAAVALVVMAATMVSHPHMIDVSTARVAQ